VEHGNTYRGWGGGGKVWFGGSGGGDGGLGVGGGRVTPGAAVVRTRAEEARGAEGGAGVRSEWVGVGSISGGGVGGGGVGRRGGGVGRMCGQGRSWGQQEVEGSEAGFGGT
jgi:hypothetical protein